jgi:hypothetical protein
MYCIQPEVYYTAIFRLHCDKEAVTCKAKQCHDLAEIGMLTHFMFTFLMAKHYGSRHHS